MVGEQMSNHLTKQMPDIGEVAEWFKAEVLKTSVRESVP
jgi:hypothetical protein